MKRFNINIKMRRKTRGLQLFLRIHFNNNNKLIVCLQECFHNVQNVSRFSTWAHPILLQHLQPLCDLPPRVCKHDICYHGKYLGNSGLQFLQVRNWGSKNLGLGKTQKEEVQWGYVWWAWGPRRRSVPSYPLVRQGFIRFWEGSLSYLLEVWLRTILWIMALKCIKIM